MVERYDLNGEVWVPDPARGHVPAHGQSGGRRLEILHYRPAKDDLVAIALPATGCASTRRRAANGSCIGGRSGFCCTGGSDFRPLQRCLSPLQTLGREALECQDVPGLREVQLTRLEWT